MKQSFNRGGYSPITAFIAVIVTALGALVTYFYLSKGQGIPTLPASNSAPPTEVADMLNPDPTFQKLLKNECKFVGTHEKYPNLKYYGIELSQLPFVLSDSVKTEFNIKQYMLCQAGASDFEENKSQNISFIYADSDKINPSASLLIGDENSINQGFDSPQLQFNLQYAHQKERHLAKEPLVLTDKGGIKTIVYIMDNSDPYYPTEKHPLALSFLTYRELGKYKILVTRDYTTSLTGDLRTMFIKYADKITDNDKRANPEYKASYVMVDGTNFFQEFFVTYFPSYDGTNPEFKSIIDANIRDINGIELKI